MRAWKIVEGAVGRKTPSLNPRGNDSTMYRRVWEVQIFEKGEFDTSWNRIGRDGPYENKMRAERGVESLKRMWVRRGIEFSEDVFA
jgi:hypothetical protein